MEAARGCEICPLCGECDAMEYDTKQINTIFWKEDVDGLKTPNGFNFADTLTQRIIATVGRGPIRPDGGEQRAGITRG